jgi:aldehyde dehydrogenase (NAD+)
MDAGPHEPTFSSSPPDTVAALRRTFDAGLTRPLDWRREELRSFQRLLADGEDELLEAMRDDMGKPAVEARLTDLSVVAAEIGVMLRNLERWARPERVAVPLVQQPGHATVVREPLGVALVIAPWNYPVHLLLLPMAAAVSAGNCVVGKPSELTPKTSAAIARLARRHLDGRAVAIVEGGVEESEALLAERFDTIFYTGNGRVGRVVMEAAAKHLTPVTLELGGKSPALVDADADMEVAARRIAWGKYLNAGQTCVAPDYVLVQRDVETTFVDSVRGSLRSFYGDDPRRSDDYARIVNDRHFERLSGLLGSTRATVAAGGETDRADRYIAPTVLTGVAHDDPVMEDEIFGPILPVVAVTHMDDAVAFVRARPKPLALYVFSRSKETVDRVLAGTTSGGVGVNCTVQQVAVPALPFGGVGASGMGAYHGRQGFETFSHRRAVLAKPTRPDPPVAYPPYTKVKEWVLKKLV